ncbi:hypothetical protein LOH54_07895 [Sulfurimonas sp. HSL-3221]|uniref:Kelch repeat-containing protein n=1 Tax=Sulfurimonadaceae TaxID=2771471 RepID=UPI001E2A4D4F|nr:kelch repeat-containing protein [Sulfurimonas sp. HSL-3221]UFS61584.1 hypothetical protein LOH54_07895 [Sulfurimonas sp. HSL-3221]
MHKIIQGFIALLSLLSFTACNTGGIECTTDMSPTIYSVPPTTATAGYRYVYYVDALYTCFPFHCNSIDGVKLPEGATVDDYADSVSWTPSSDLIGKKVYFKIATEPDSCDRRTAQAWYVTVYAAPAIASFSANRTAVGPGESVELVATFTGSGSIEGIGPVSSGVPVVSDPLTATTTFTLTVANDVGAVKTGTVTVEVQAPPVIDSFSASPAIVTTGGSSLLSWSRSGTVTSIQLDPGAIAIPTNVYQYTVTPAASTLYTLTLSNDTGNSTSSSLTVSVVPPPSVTALTASPTSATLGGSVTLTGSFTDGSGVIERSDGGGFYSVGAIASGGSVDSGVLMRTTTFRLKVTNDAGAVAVQTLLVPITGPATFQPALHQPLNPTRSAHTATKLQDGRVFIAGGRIDGNSTVSTELFDPVTETFTAGPDMHVARRNHTAALLQDGRVLIVGGYTSLSHRLFSAELYDPAAGTTAFLGDLNVSDMVAPESVTLDDGRVLIVHTSLGQGSEVFDPVTETFSAVGPMLISHGCISLQPLNDGNGTILLVDGYYTNASSLFSPKSDTFTLTGATSYYRCYFATAALPDGRVLLVGGDDPAEVYDPSSGTYRDSNTTLYNTYFPRAVTLDDHRILVVDGGLPWAEIYDATVDGFSLTGGLREAHTEASATLLDDGRILVVGGCYDPCTAELYTP